MILSQEPCLKSRRSTDPMKRSHLGREDGGHGRCPHFIDTVILDAAAAPATP